MRIKGSKNELGTHHDIIIETIGFGQINSDIEITVANQKEPKKFGGFQLHIPEYQHPYVWREKQVEILLNDLKDAIESDKSLLGSLILHQEVETKDIKDEGWNTAKAFKWY